MFFNSTNICACDPNSWLSLCSCDFFLAPLSPSPLFAFQFAKTKISFIIFYDFVLFWECDLLLMYVCTCWLFTRYEPFGIELSKKNYRKKESKQLYPKWQLSAISNMCIINFYVKEWTQNEMLYVCECVFLYDPQTFTERFSSLTYSTPVHF